MQKTAAVLTTILVLALAGACAAYSQEHEHDTMPAHHGGPTLFLAQLSGAEVVPPSGSAATGTGAFQVDFKRGSAAYDLTYHGLEHGAPRRIALYNFSRGGKGALLHVLCGEANAPACPSGVSGNLTGTWDVSRALQGRRRSELTSARIYAEITGGDGKPEIRGQLEPNNAMLPVRNFVAHLTPVAEPGARGVGTAIMSEVHHADGRVSVFYHATVAGTSSAPVNAAVGGAPPAAATPNASALRPRYESRNALPQLRVLTSRAAPTSGGTLTARYTGRRDGDTDAMFATRAAHESGGRGAGITVTTTRFPNGELFGVFVPVR